MEQENVVFLDIKSITTKIFQLSVFVGLIVVAPYFSNQLITGSIVNAILFISVIYLGLGSAFMLCVIPSLISVYTGLLPIALAPMIPFIMAGNALLISTFNLLKKNYWLGAISASIIKFIFIWLTGTILVSSVLHGTSKVIIQMISWPQFVTAIAGASLAFLFLKVTKKI